MKNLLTKVRGRLSDLSATAGLLICSASLPEEREAMGLLQKASPDLGGSCRTDRGPDYEKRSLQLSVIVPAYNVETSIARCLDSVLRQQVSFSYEIIVVNDGSTDGTKKRLSAYARHPQIRMIHQENRGLSGARNTGIACARGEYLCFVDSDDELPAGALEAMLSQALENKGMLVAGSIEKCTPEGKRQYVTKLQNKKLEMEKLPGFAWGKAIHYSVFRQLQFPEKYWFEDSIMAQIVHPLCRDVTYTTDAVCYRCYSNEAGITSRARGKMKSIDSLWITMRLLEERAAFALAYTQEDYAYFLSMVSLTYHRTKRLGKDVTKSIFTVQRALLRRYYHGYSVTDGGKKQRIQQALRSNAFKKYILACESKN